MPVNNKVQPTRNTHTILILIVFLLTSCSTLSSQRNLQQMIRTGNLESAITALNDNEEEKESKSDTQRLLNLGMLYRLQSDYGNSITTWNHAKKRISALRPTSVTETTASFLFNDNTQSYIGSYQEQQFLHLFQALNYLDIHKPFEARVELLQANQLHKEFANGALEPPFLRYLSGMVFEMTGEHDQALVAYRKALAIYPKSKTPTPTALYTDMARMMHKLGLRSELKQFSSKHGIQQEQLSQAPNVTLIWLQSFVSQKQEKRITHWAPNTGQSISLALPYYPPLSPLDAMTAIHTGDHNLTFTEIENIDASIRQEFSATEATLLAKTVARQLIKVNLGNALIDSQTNSKESRLSGQLIGSLFNVLTESADVRSWNTLPYRVLLYRGTIKQGSRLILNQFTPNVITIDEKHNAIIRTIHQHS